jgi:sugar lactone lactonase YvrE
MKTIFTRAFLFASGFLLLTIFSCSKKEVIKPTDNNTAVVPVYDAYNHVPLYPTTGIVVDASGNLYMTDIGGSAIWKITPAGNITTFVGGASIGAADGSGAGASFNLPIGLAIDAANNIFVADAANNLIRKVTPAGIVTTLAGSGVIGSANGKGTAASFNFPQGIAVDNNGNIYVADTGNDLIRKITPDGNVTTLAGKIASGKTNGTGSTATFNIPLGLAVDVTGDLYVADAGNNLIRKITPAGVVTTFAGSGYAESNDGVGTLASFNFPNALAIRPNGNLFVTEAHSHNASKITPDGKATAIDLSGFAYPYTLYNWPAGFAPPITLPNGVAFDNTNGNIFILDYGTGILMEGSGS